MKLYHSPTSPYVRKVMALITLAGAADRVELVPGSGSAVAPNPETCAVNPLGKIPCLVTETGEAIADSRVITRYLDHRFATGLYPEPPALWGVLSREALADGICDAAFLMVMEGRLRPEALRFAPWVQGQMAKIERAIEHFETEAAERGIGDTPDAARLALAAALGYLDLRFAEMGWRARAPNLASWAAGYLDRPEMRATAPA